MLHVFGQSVGQFNDFESGREMELESESELQNEAETSVFVEIVEIRANILGRMIWLFGIKCFLTGSKMSFLEVNLLLCFTVR